MALTTPKKASGMYANPTIQILVGDKEVPFHVHFSFLEKTSFFDVHGSIAPPTPDPSPTRPNQAASPAPSERTLGPEDLVKVEEGVSNESVPSAAFQTPPISVQTPPQYKLKGVIYEPAAFETVVNYLYSQSPNTPLHRNAFRTLRKSYVLALQYGIEGLQDEIIDCMRNFHTSYAVNFEDFIWFVNRLDGDENAICQVPIIQYFIAQIAYEIYREGYDLFSTHNTSFEMFLEMGNRPLRKELFKAMVKIATATRPTDPATGANAWTVEGRPIRNNVNREPSIGIVDLED